MFILLSLNYSKETHATEIQT